MDGSVALAARLFDRFGIARDDIDAAMIYDAFSPILLMQLEALGFCGLGEAKDFIADGNLALDGALPCNTNGGLIGEGYIHGLNLVLEADAPAPGHRGEPGPDAAHGPRDGQPHRRHPDRRRDPSTRHERSDAMASVLEGIRCSTSRRGSPGRSPGMLLADHGADVIKVEPPGGDPLRGTAGYDAWLRGRRSAELDLNDAGDRATFLALASRRRRRPGELLAGHHRATRHRRRHAARRQPAAGVLLDHRVRHAPGAPRPARLRRAGRRPPRSAPRAARSSRRRGAAHERRRARTCRTWRSPTAWRPARPARDRSSPTRRGRAWAPRSWPPSASTPRCSRGAHRPWPARRDLVAAGGVHVSPRRSGSAPSTTTRPATAPGSTTSARRRASSAAPTAGGSSSGCPTRAFVLLQRRR